MEKLRGKMFAMCSCEDVCMCVCEGVCVYVCVGKRYEDIWDTYLVIQIDYPYRTVSHPAVLYKYIASSLWPQGFAARVIST